MDVLIDVLVGKDCGNRSNHARRIGALTARRILRSVIGVIADLDVRTMLAGGLKNAVSEVDIAVGIVGFPLGVDFLRDDIERFAR